MNEDVPTDWKIALLCPILKPGKDSMKPNSFRPISMLSCVGKLAERLVNNRLDWYIEHNKLLMCEQAGFRKQRSTYDQIALLEDSIKKAINENHLCVAVFLDMAGAFDAVNHTAVLFKMTKLGLSGRLIGWLRSYLVDRTFKILYRGEKSSSRKILCGVPQGGILSPLLFNVLLSDIPLTEGVKISVFADDIAIHISGANEEDLINKIQLQLNALQEWGKQWGQTFNPNKTKALVFGKNIPDMPLLELNKEQIQYVTSHRFLGLIFDAPNLTWKNHINFLKSACQKRISLMKSVSHNHWGGDRRILMMMYTSLVRSKLDYGSPFYGNAVATEFTWRT